MRLLSNHNQQLVRVELGIECLVRAFGKCIIRERDDEDHMTSITAELLAKAANRIWQSLRSAMGATTRPQFGS
jgi:hypothetical protein